MLLCKMHFSAHVKKRCFLILHGSVLTHAWWSKTFWYLEVRNSLLVNLVQKLSESVNICKSYSRKFTGTFFYGPQWPQYTENLTPIYLHRCKKWFSQWYVTVILIKQVFIQAIPAAHFSRDHSCWKTAFHTSKSGAMTTYESGGQIPVYSWHQISSNCYVPNIIRIIFDILLRYSENERGHFCNTMFCHWGAGLHVFCQYAVCGLQTVCCITGSTVWNWHLNDRYLFLGGMHAPDWFVITSGKDGVFYLAFLFIYLYIFICCLLRTLHKNYRLDLHENYTRNVSLDKEVTIKF